VAVTLSAGGADVPTISWSGLASNDCPSAMTILTTWTNVKSDAIVVASANVQNSVSSSATSVSVTFPSVNPAWAFVDAVDYKNSPTLTPGAGQVPITSVSGTFATGSIEADYKSPIGCSSACVVSEGLSTSQPVILVALAVDPPPPLCSNTNSGAILGAGMAILLFIVLMAVTASQMLKGEVHPENVKLVIGTLVILAVAILILYAVAQTSGGGGNC